MEQPSRPCERLLKIKINLTPSYLPISFSARGSTLVEVQHKSRGLRPPGAVGARAAALQGGNAVAVRGLLLLRDHGPHNNW